MCGGSDLWWPAGQVFRVAGCNSEYAFWVSFVRKLQGIIHPFSDNSFTLFNQMLVTVCLTCQCHVYTHSLTHTLTCTLTHTLTLSHTHTHTLTHSHTHSSHRSSTGGTSKDKSPQHQLQRLGTSKKSPSGSGLPSLKTRQLNSLSQVVSLAPVILASGLTVGEW